MRFSIIMKIYRFWNSKPSLGKQFSTQLRPFLVANSDAQIWILGDAWCVASHVPDTMVHGVVYISPMLGCCAHHLGFASLGRYDAVINKVYFVSNPLLPNISMHILHTVLWTFPNVLIRRICSQSRASLVDDHFLYSHDLNLWLQGDIVGKK